MVEILSGPYRHRPRTVVVADAWSHDNLGAGNARSERRNGSGRRTERGREIDALAPAVPLLRRHERADRDRLPEFAGCHALEPPGGYCGDSAGYHALQRYDCIQYRNRTAGK